MVVNYTAAVCRGAVQQTLPSLECLGCVEVQGKPPFRMGNMFRKHKCVARKEDGFRPVVNKQTPNVRACGLEGN
jgi:hypothetical protein